MRLMIAAAALLVFCLPVSAQQNGTITFDLPNTGGAPTGFRLYRDNVLVGAVASGQTLSALLPGNTGTWTIGVEAFNATGPGPRVNKSVTVGPVVPGPVRNLVITLNCETTNPPTCTVSVNDAP